jgi:DNA polymerase-3 subunit epsilon
MRPLAFVDLETTGLDPQRHEIIEIGAIRVDSSTLAVLAEVDVRVAPVHIERADPESLRINGYSAEGWVDAVDLHEAFDQVAPLLDGAVLAGHNVGFDKNFLNEGWKRLGRVHPKIDHHTLDTASLAWPLYTAGAVESLSLSPLCDHFGIRRVFPHRAIDDARAALELAKHLMPSVRLTTRLAALGGDEREILELLLARLGEGHQAHGPFAIAGGEDYPHEALLKVVDGLSLAAAELLRISRARTEPPARRPRVFVCTAQGGGEGEAPRAVRWIRRALSESGVTALVPQIFLGSFSDEATEKHALLSLSLLMIDSADEVHVYGAEVTPLMKAQIAYAEAHDIPVRRIVGGP